VIDAAKEAAHVFPLAALRLFAEKPHRGHHAPSSTFRPGALLAISNTATGMAGCLYDSSTRSCCSGKERGAESGLDYFGARYMSSAQGRFTSPDWSETPAPIPYADLTDPQTLNLYSYARNNPLSNRDEDGHDFVCTSDDKGNFNCTESQPAPPPDKPPTPTLMMAGVGVLAFGSELGPPDWALGAVLLGLGCVQTHCSTARPATNTVPDTTYLSKDNIPKDAADPNGAKAPGKPGEREGFKDPKSGPKWGKAPNGKSGWVDAKGNVWVPTGQAPSIAHGGPHWDVQLVGGGYQNVRPGGQLQ
jgi:RHS repeat-associated protein